MLLSKKDRHMAGIFYYYVRQLSHHISRGTYFMVFFHGTFKGTESEDWAYFVKRFLKVGTIGVRYGTGTVMYCTVRYIWCGNKP